MLQLAALVELFQNRGEVVDVETNLFLRHDLWNALQGELIVGVEREVGHLHLPPLSLHLVNLLLDAHEVLALNQLGHQFDEQFSCRILLTFAGRLVGHQFVEFVHSPAHPLMVLALLVGELQFVHVFGNLRVGRSVLFQFVYAVVIAVFLFKLLLVPLELAVFLVLQEQSLTQLVALLGRIFVEGMEVFLVVLHNRLVDDLVLNLGSRFVAFEDEEDERFEEVLLFPEVLFILLGGHLEWVHRDGLVLGVGDVSAMKRATYTFVRVAGIYHDNVGILLQKLPDDAIHMKALPAAAWPEAKEVGIVCHLHFALLAGDVYGHWQSLPVCIEGGERSHLRLFQMLLEKEAQGAVGQGQEQVVVL